MSSLIYWLDSSLSHQMWSAHWIHGAGKSGPRCYETHLNNVLDRHLCTRVGSDCPGSDDEPPSTRRTLIPTLSYGEDMDIHSVVLLQIYWRIFFFFFFAFLPLALVFCRRRKTSKTRWLVTWRELLRLWTVCRVCAANRWREERLCSPECTFHLHSFRKPRWTWI